MTTTIWAEKHRPNSLAGYVFSNPQQASQIKQWVSSKEVPHILLTGGPGCGKTTLAKILVNELNIDPYDLLFLNASRQNSVDDMRNQITTFVSIAPYGETRMKIVILDEADYLTPNSQAILRGLMEQYASGSRFFLTANYSNSIIPAIHSRVQTI